MCIFPALGLALCLAIDGDRDERRRLLVVVVTAVEVVRGTDVAVVRVVVSLVQPDLDWWDLTPWGVWQGWRQVGQAVKPI